MQSDRRPLALAVALAAYSPKPPASVTAGADGAPAAVSCAEGSITGQGSSAQANAMNTWIRNYQASCPDAAIEYASIGSGAGIETFIPGTGDFAGTDAPLSPAAQPEVDARCGSGPAIHLSMVVGPIAVAYNVAQVGNGAGEFVDVSDEAAGRTVATAEFAGSGSDLQLDLDYQTTAAGAYPIVLVTYQVVCQEGTPAESLELVKGFLTYTAGVSGQAAVTRLGYAPLPDDVRGKVAAAVAGLA